MRTVVACACVVAALIGETPAQDPCNDSLYVVLRSKNLDSMTQNEVGYYLHYRDKCGEYSAAVGPYRKSGGRVSSSRLSSLPDLRPRSRCWWRTEAHSSEADDRKRLWGGPRCVV